MFLGRDTPPPDLLAAVERIGAKAVLLSFAARTNPGQSGWELAALRERLPRDVVLAVGGAGTPAELPAGVVAPGLEQLAPWLASLRR